MSGPGAAVAAGGSFSLLTAQQPLTRANAQVCVWQVKAICYFRTNLPFTIRGIYQLLVRRNEDTTIGNFLSPAEE